MDGDQLILAVFSSQYHTTHFGSFRCSENCCSITCPLKNTLISHALSRGLWGLPQDDEHSCVVQVLLESRGSLNQDFCHLENCGLKQCQDCNRPGRLKV